MKLHRDLGITQKSAWFMAQRLRESWNEGNGATLPPMTGPVEVDETFIGGKEMNKHAKKKLHVGAGKGGKITVIGAKDRATNTVTAEVVPDAYVTTLHEFVNRTLADDATLYTDGYPAYKHTGHEHKSVNHSVGQYVDGQAHTNGIESFWSMLKRGYHGTYHHLSKKHLQRYVNEFAGRQNMRQQDTEVMMQNIYAGLIGKRLMYRDLIA